MVVISIRLLADDKHVGAFVIWLAQAVFISSRILSPKNEKVFLCVVANAGEYRTSRQAHRAVSTFGQPQWHQLSRVIECWQTQLLAQR